jgi:hypothetical protein
VKAGVTGVTRYACVALRSGASLLLALRLTCLARPALSVAGIGRTRPALRVTGISRTCATLRVASIARTCAALRIAGLTSDTRVLTAARVAGFAGSTLSDGTRIALCPGTGVVTRKPEVCAGRNGDRGFGVTQLDVEVKLVRCCRRIVLS